MTTLSLRKTKNAKKSDVQILCKGEKRGNTPREQGFTRGVTGRETEGNELAPPVANSCGVRANVLRRSPKDLAFLAFGVGLPDAAIAKSYAKIQKNKEKSK